LQTITEGASPRQIDSALSTVATGATAVTYEDVQRIEAEERSRAALARVEELKFKSNDEMLALLRR